jgi:hypothetical protein
MTAAIAREGHPMSSLFDQFATDLRATAEDIAFAALSAALALALWAGPALAAQQDSEAATAPVSVVEKTIAAPLRAAFGIDADGNFALVVTRTGDDQ